MISENPYDELIESIEESFKEILTIAKSLGNEKRLKILIFLLKRTNSFGVLMYKINLKKTALSNHLSHLINAKLIEKVDFGVYSITGDGIEFMEAIERAYHQSPSREKKRFKALQTRAISNSFLNRYSQREQSKTP